MFTNEVTSMEQHGFIQDMLDVKVLILFVMAKLSYPVTLQTIYELCYQDDKLSYFDVSSPSGLPMATTVSPTFSVSESPRTTGVRSDASIFRTAMSLLSS